MLAVEAVLLVWMSEILEFRAVRVAVVREDLAGMVLQTELVLRELLTQAVVVVEDKVTILPLLMAALAVPALLLFAMQIHLMRQLPRLVVRRLPLVVVIAFTHSPDLGALLSNGTLRTG
jgi:hypothetical protein